MDEFYTNSLLFHLWNRDDPVYRRSFSFSRIEGEIAMTIFEVDMIIVVRKFYGGIAGFFRRMWDNFIDTDV